MIILILKAIFLVLGLMFTGANVSRMIYKNPMPAANWVWWAISVGGFIFLQWVI